MSDRHTIINIGRQFGSGGKEVATKIGEVLGIEVYDNELISKAAEESGFSTKSCSSAAMRKEVSSTCFPSLAPTGSEALRTIWETMSYSKYRAM